MASRPSAPAPAFRINLPISFHARCATPAAVDRLREKPSPGGTALMELGEYPFSTRVGWMQDKFGVSWQVIHTEGEIRQQKGDRADMPAGRNPEVDAFLGKATRWQPEMEKLRTILLGCQLAEGLKWGVPCYTFEQGNVVLIHAFKEYCALLFFKGALLKDPHGILVRQTESVQAARQVRFASVREIEEMEPVLRAYVGEAMEVERAGLKVAFAKGSDLALPEELQARLDETPALRAAFGALTPGRQRAYILYFSAPKQAKTRASRVEKCLERILNGKGLDDP